MKPEFSYAGASCPLVVSGDSAAQSRILCGFATWCFLGLAGRGLASLSKATLVTVWSLKPKYPAAGTDFASLRPTEGLGEYIIGILPQVQMDPQFL